MRLLRLTLAVIALASTTAHADATLPPMGDAAKKAGDGDGVATVEEKPIACGTAPWRELRDALAAFCATTTGDEARGCRHLRRAFSRCKGAPEVYVLDEHTLRTDAPLPEQKNHDPMYWSATFERRERRYRVIEIHRWEDCP